jgi:hypothetical protein
MADQTQRLEIATVRAEVGSNIVYRFANDAANEGGIPTDSGSIQNLKQVILEIQSDAAEKISIATTIYQTAAAGLAATADGGIFLVQSSDADTIYTVWKNQAGAAVNTGKTAMSSQAIEQALTASNEAAQAAEDAADIATSRTAGFLQPAAESPVTRDDGLPLQEGDRYFNTEQQTEYLYKSEGWSANDSLEAIALLEESITVAPSPSGIPRADTSGKLDSAWLPSALTESIARAQAKIDYWIDARDYGAVPGASSDQSAAMNAAAAAALAQGKGLKVSGTYRLYLPVNFRNVPLDAAEATFFLDTSDKIGLILGGDASQSWNPRQEVGKVFRVDESLTVPSIRVMGAKGQRIHVGRTHYLQLFASTTAPDTSRSYSIAYSTFQLGHITQLELSTDPLNASGPANSGAGGSVQWINENQFFINRCMGLLITGSYTHNHNKFHAGTWEGPCTIRMDTGFHNYVLGARFEAGPTTVIFGAQSANCWLQKTWDGTIDDREPGLINGTVTDAGTCNVVADDFSLRHNISCIAYASINDPITNNSADLPARLPLLQRVGGTAGNAPVLMSDKIRIERNMQFYWAWLDYDPADAVLYRPYMEFFDKNGVPINAATAWALTPGATTPSGNFLSTGTGVGPSNYWATIVQAALTAGAVYVRVGTRISSGQVAGSLARSLAIYCSVPPNVVFQGAAESKRRDMAVVTAAPTQGFVPVGYTCVLSTGASLYVCTFALDTLSTAALSAAGTSLAVASATGVAVGDRIGINMDNRDTHWTTVSAVSGATVTLAAGVTSASASGSRVVFNRQVVK